MHLVVSYRWKPYGKSTDVILQSNVYNQNIVAIFRETADIGVINQSIIAFREPISSNTIIAVNLIKFEYVETPQDDVEDLIFRFRRSGVTFVPHYRWFRDHAKGNIYEIRIMRLLLIQRKLCTQLPKDIMYLIINYLFC